MIEINYRKFEHIISKTTFFLDLIYEFGSFSRKELHPYRLATCGHMLKPNTSLAAPLFMFLALQGDLLSNACLKLHFVGDLLLEYPLMSRMFHH